MHSAACSAAWPNRNSCRAATTLVSHGSQPPTCLRGLQPDTSKAMSMTKKNTKLCLQCEHRIRHSGGRRLLELTRRRVKQTHAHAPLAQEYNVIQSALERSKYPLPSVWHPGTLHDEGLHAQGHKRTAVKHGIRIRLLLAFMFASSCSVQSCTQCVMTLTAMNDSTYYRTPIGSDTAS